MSAPVALVQLYDPGGAALTNLKRNSHFTYSALVRAN